MYLICWLLICSKFDLTLNEKHCFIYCYLLDSLKNTASFIAVSLILWKTLLHLLLSPWFFEKHCFIYCYLLDSLKNTASFIAISLILFYKHQSLGFRVTLWTHPFVNKDCITFPDLDNKGYLVQVRLGLQVVKMNAPPFHIENEVYSVNRRVQFICIAKQTFCFKIFIIHCMWNLMIGF